MTDQELVDRIKQGSPQDKDRAFGELVTRYRERLYGVIYGMVKNHEDTDDLLQETLIRAYRKMRNFRGDSSIYTWLVRIGINLSLTHLRKARLRNFLSFDVAAETVASREPLQDRMAEETELQHALRSAVDHLPEKQRVVFTLRHYDELSHGEIADITGNSVGTIKANFFHALKNIKQHLEKHYPDLVKQGMKHETQSA
jgi:RNA polymerase sigma-70 factor (ECF subfamily)